VDIATGTGGSGTVGPGTVNRVAKFTAATVVGDSGISDNGTTVSIAATEFISSPRAGTNCEIFGGGAGAALAAGGERNSALGRNALASNVTGDDITAVGYQALQLATAGPNTAIGSGALGAVTSGTANTALGLNAGGSQSTQIGGTFLGSNAGAANATAFSTFIGADAGAANTSGANNTALGYQALTSCTVGFGHTAIGYRALAATGNTQSATAVGDRAGEAFTGNYGTFIGWNAGILATGSDNTFLGGRAGNTVINGTSNVIIGANAQQTGAANSNAVIIGAAATGGPSCVTIGQGSTNQGTSCIVVGQGSTLGAVGTAALIVGAGCTGISGAIQIGNAAGALNTGGTDVCIGRGSKASGVTIGTGSGNNQSSSGNNVIVGSLCAAAVTNSSNNVIVGHQAATVLNNFGGNSVIIGKSAGLSPIATSRFVLVGARSDIAAAADGGIAIGGGFADVGAQVLHAGSIVMGCSNAVAITTTGIVFAFVDSSPDTITRSAGSFVADGFLAGQRVLVSGAAAANNNGTFLVTVVAAGTLTVVAVNGSDAGLSNAAAGPSITIGVTSSAISTASAQFVAGSVAYPIDNVYFGKGVIAMTPTTAMINGTGGAGDNIAGGDVGLAGGRNTGSGNPGTLVFRFSAVGGAASTLGTLIDSLKVRGRVTPDAYTAAGTTDGADTYFRAQDAGAGGTNRGGNVYWRMAAGVSTGAPGKFILQSAAGADVLEFNKIPGLLTITQPVRTSGTATILIATGGAHTTLTDAESMDVNFNLARTVQFTSNVGFALQRAVNISAPTYAFAAATGTIASAATVFIDREPQVGTNCLITNAYSFWVNTGKSRFGGGVLYPYNLQNNTAATVAINSFDSNTVYTNTGAGATVQMNLPAAYPGLVYTFIVTVAQIFRIWAVAGSYIRLAGSISAASDRGTTDTVGYCDASVIGNTVTLVAVGLNDWIATSVVGAWNLV